MKLIDRYIVRQFLTTTLFALFAVTLVFIIIDAMENLRDFIDKQATAPIIALYYFYFIPEIIKLIMPVAMLLGSLFVTARLSTQNEMTAIKATGTSLYRTMVPFIVVALIVSAVSVYFNGWIVPKANKKKFNIERQYLNKNTISGSGANIYIQDSPTRVLSIGYFDDTQETATRVSVQDFSDTNYTILVARVDAQTMVWDSTARQWILHNGVRRWFSDKGESFEKFNSQISDKLHFDPDDLRRKQEQPDEMDYRTLETFIENPAPPRTYMPSAPEVVGAGALAGIKNDDVAVDSYTLTATGPGSGYVTLIAGNGRAFTPEGDPVSVRILKVVDTLYRGEVNIVESSNPLNEKLVLQQVVDLAAVDEAIAAAAATKADLPALERLRAQMQARLDQD